MKIFPLILSSCKSKGFSLIELMVVLSIAAILLTMAVPSFSGLLQNQRITATTNDFFAAVKLTRAEAIARGARVDLMPAGAGDDWANGWIVFIDANKNHRMDKGDRLIYTHGPVPRGIGIAANFTDSATQYLAYNGTGRARTNAGSESIQAGSWKFSQDEKIKRVITINFTGRARVCNPERKPIVRLGLIAQR